jgi:hypothetical protein
MPQSFIWRVSYLPIKDTDLLAKVQKCIWSYLPIKETGPIN